MVVETKPADPEEMKGSTVHQAIKWLSGQEFNNVLLALILTSLAGLAWYGTPALLKQIQDGYERINERHSVDLEHARFVFQRDSDRQYQVIQTLLRARGIDIPNTETRPASAAEPVIKP